VTAALAKLGNTSDNNVSRIKWGRPGRSGDQPRLIALITFFIVVVIYISFRFEPKMRSRRHRDAPRPGRDRRHLLVGRLLGVPDTVTPS